MNRRTFVASSASTALAFSKLRELCSAQSLDRSSDINDAHRLFPRGLPDDRFVEFSAEGFQQSVSGVIHNRRRPAKNGMPLGGIGTGYLTVETTGCCGDCTFFNSGVPLRPLFRPFLSLRVAGSTWLLSTESLPGLRCASDIAYWGHYPIADLEYETDAPVAVGMRAWSPFIPGDASVSNTPGAVFQLGLRNESRERQRGSIVFSFPGPTQAEAQIAPGSLRVAQTLGWYRVNVPASDALAVAHRTNVSGRFNGISVISESGTGYSLGVIGEERIQFGRAIGEVEGYPEETAGEWAASVRGPANHGYTLPPAQKYDFSSSLQVEFDLAPEETKIMRIVLAWYSPWWRGEGENTYKRMYATRFADATQIAQMLAEQHDALLGRVVAWQQVIYSNASLPLWLKDPLVNVLYLLAKDSYWAAAQKPIGEWCRPEDGLFGLTESPRECPQIECIPCSFYGNIPLFYFFPDLALSTLRGYKAYQFQSGAVPWIFGGITGAAAQGFRETDGADLATPSPGYQVTLNGSCYADLVDRLWQRTGDDHIMQEFYASVKKSTIFTMNLRRLPEGIVSVPAGNVNPFSPPYSQGNGLSPGQGLDWFEGNGIFGMSPHVAGIHLAHLRLVQRMAESQRDREFAQQCRDWVADGERLLERKLWTGAYYLAYYEPETGKKSDLVFSAQLDGEWIGEFHGIKGIFPPDRVHETLATIRRNCVRHTRYGVINFTEADGSLVPGVGYGAYGMFVPEVYMFAMTLIYCGVREAGLEILENCLKGLILEHRYSWTQPNVLRGDTGERTYGTDYYQNMMLWAVPAALQNRDLRGPCRSGGLVEQIIRAARPVTPSRATSSWALDS